MLGTVLAAQLFLLLVVVHLNTLLKVCRVPGSAVNFEETASTPTGKVPALMESSVKWGRQASKNKTKTPIKQFSERRNPSDGLDGTRGRPPRMGPAEIGKLTRSQRARPAEAPGGHPAPTRRSASTSALTLFLLHHMRECGLYSFQILTNGRAFLCECLYVKLKTPLTPALGSLSCFAVITLVTICSGSGRISLHPWPQGLCPSSSCGSITRPRTLTVVLSSWNHALA